MDVFLSFFILPFLRITVEFLSEMKYVNVPKELNASRENVFLNNSKIFRGRSSIEIVVVDMLHLSYFNFAAELFDDVENMKNFNVFQNDILDVHNEFEKKIGAWWRKSKGFQTGNEWIFKKYTMGIITNYSSKRKELYVVF